MYTYISYKKLYSSPQLQAGTTTKMIYIDSLLNQAWF